MASKPFIDMDRSSSIKFKLMPDGHIRGLRTNRPDLPGVSELQTYPPQGICPTISTAHAPKLLIADERLYQTLLDSVLR